MLDFIAEPFGVIMSFLYEYLAFENYGVAIILFTLFVRILLFPLTLKQQKSMLKTQALQPELEALRRSCGNDSQLLMQEQQKLYAKYDVNPMSGCLPMLIQLPILLAIYNIIRGPLVHIAGLSSEVIAKLGELAGYAENAANYQIEINSKFLSDATLVQQAVEGGIIESGDVFVNMTFLKIFNLGVSPWTCISNQDWSLLPLILIPILTLATQYLMQRITQPRKKDKKNEDPSMKSMNLMLKLMPLMTFYFAFITPAGLGFYWAIGNILSLLQTVLINKVFIKKKEV